MAYTGILVRNAASHADLIADPPINREIAISEKALVLGYDSGNGIVLFPLNYNLLSKIGTVAADGSIAFAGIKTSEIPIEFDGTGDLKVSNLGITIKDSSFLSASLKYIKSVDFTNIVITDGADPETTKDLVIDDIIRVSAITAEQIAILAAESDLPVLSNPSTTTVDIANVQGTTIVVDESEVSLGTLTADGTLTFSTAQVSGARVYAYSYDISKNRSKRTSILIP